MPRNLLQRIADQSEATEATNGWCELPDASEVQAQIASAAQPKRARKSRAKSTKKAPAAPPPAEEESVTLEVQGEVAFDLPDPNVRLDEVKAATGEQRLTIQRPDWSKFAEECICVRLACSFWRANGRMDLQKLGLDTAPEEFREFARQYLKLGQIKLLPGRYLKPLESKTERARQVLEESGYKSPWGNGAYMVTVRGYPNARQELGRLEGEAREALGRILDNYDEIVTEVRHEYRKLVAVQFAVRAGRKPEEADTLSEEENDAVARAVEGIIGDPLNGIKSKAEIEAKFVFTWVPSYVEKPAMIGAGSNVADLEARAHAARTALDALNARIDAQNIAVHDFAARREAELRLADLEKRLEADRLIARDMAERAAGAQMKEVAGLLDSAAAKVAGLLYASAKQLRQNVTNRQERGREGRVTLTESKRLAKVAAQVRELVAWDDPNVERLAKVIEDLSVDLEAGVLGEGEDAAEHLDRTLGDIQSLMRADLIALGNPGGEDLDLPAADLVLADTDRQAEAFDRLGLAEPDAVEVEEHGPVIDLWNGGGEGREL